MTKADSTYQNTKVQLPQGADRLSVDSDGYFDFFGTTVTGQQMYNQLYSPLQNAIIINSVGALSVINLPADTGYIIFSITDAASNASAWLTSGAKEGQELTLMTRGGGSIGSVFISTSGVTIVGLLSGDVSSIQMHQSAASQAFVKMVCFTDGEWSIIETTGQVTLQASA